MPNYFKELLKNRKHISPSKPVHVPHKWSEPAYGQKIKFAKDDDKSPRVDQKGIRRIQYIVGSCLHYGREIYSTFLTALNDIGSQQAESTTNTKVETDWLVDY